MQAEKPIACTLTSAALMGRLDWIRRVTSRSLVSHRLSGSTLHLTYRLDAKADVEQIVVGERECCSFLEFKLREAPDGFELTIYAPDDVVGAAARWLFAQFLPVDTPRATCGCAPGACG